MSPEYLKPLKASVKKFLIVCGLYQLAQTRFTDYSMYSSESCIGGFQRNPACYHALLLELQQTSGKLDYLLYNMPLEDARVAAQECQRLSYTQVHSKIERYIDTLYVLNTAR